MASVQAPVHGLKTLAHPISRLTGPFCNGPGIGEVSMIRLYGGARFLGTAAAGARSHLDAEDGRSRDLLNDLPRCDLCFALCSSCIIARW
jgi:hypothetical protein